MNLTEPLTFAGQSRFCLDDETPGYDAVRKEILEICGTAISKIPNQIEYNTIGNYTDTFGNRYIKKSSVERIRRLSDFTSLISTVPTSQFHPVIPEADIFFDINTNNMFAYGNL